MTSYDMRQKQWQMQVVRLARRGLYAKVRQAKGFFEAFLLPTWSDVALACSVALPVLGATELLVVHLFVQGVLGVGSEELPEFIVWPPWQVGRNGLQVAWRGIPVGDIGRLIRRPRSSVETALAGFKGMGERGRQLRPFCNVMSLPTGVVLDGWLSPRAVTPFMYTLDEYTAALQFAIGRSASFGEFVRRLNGWCDEAFEVDS